MVQISWLWGLDKINPERVGAANDGGKSRGQPVNIGDFSALFPEFTAAGAVILGISRDSLRAHENFKCKQEFPFELGSDADEKVCQQFGVIKEKMMYGKLCRGIERSTFVIDKAGKLRREWRAVKVAGHAQEVLDFVNTL